MVETWWLGKMHMGLSPDPSGKVREQALISGYKGRYAKTSILTCGRFSDHMNLKKTTPVFDSRSLVTQEQPLEAV
jgi:hypothetical protein